MTEVIEKVSFGKKVREKLIFRFIQRHQREFVRSTSMITLYIHNYPLHMTECTICLYIFFWDYCDTVDPSQPYVRSYCGIIFVASNKHDMILI